MKACAPRGRATSRRDMIRRLDGADAVGEMGLDRQRERLSPRERLGEILRCETKGMRL